MEVVKRFKLEIKENHTQLSMVSFETTGKTF